MILKKSFAFAFGVLLVGCGSPQSDPTPNQPDPTESNYVNGPFGYSEGSIIENLKFTAKEGKGVAYDTLPLKPISLASYYADKAVKYVLINGGARWCGPCNDEQAFVPGWQAKFEPRGVRILEVLLEGRMPGVPATESDLDKWAAAFGLEVAIGLDPEGRMFQYVDRAALPVNMIVRTSDMRIVYQKTGLQDIEAVFESLL